MECESRSHVVARASRGFEREFAAPPAVVGVAPGRVNLIGEHTDYNQGLVLPIAIDACCVCAAGVPRAAAQGGRFAVEPPSRLRLVALDVGERVELGGAPDAWPAAAAASPSGNWLRYVLGVLEGVRRLAGSGAPPPPLDVCITSSVPIGGGLSSSAALEVSAAVAACRAWGIPVPPALDLARLCQRAEHEFARVPCGLMDQCASIMARAGRALLLDCRSMHMRHAPIPSGPTGLAVVIVNTGVRHALAAGQYARRRGECEAACQAMGLASLRDATPDRVEVLADRLLRRRARHVVAENARVLAFVEAMRLGDAAAAGRLMRESHASLRDDYEVSCPELDKAVLGLTRIRGVLGARMTGGGFGGSAIALVERESAERVVKQAMDIALGASARVATPVDGAWVVNGFA